MNKRENRNVFCAEKNIFCVTDERGCGRTGVPEIPAAEAVGQGIVRDCMEGAEQGNK